VGGPPWDAFAHDSVGARQREIKVFGEALGVACAQDIPDQHQTRNGLGAVVTRLLTALLFVAIGTHSCIQTQASAQDQASDWRALLHFIISHYQILSF
jgi:hypothetical protein